jgi:hypothetical protein
VQIDDVARPGSVVKSVDILRDDASDDAGTFEFGEGVMPDVRLGR